MRAVVVIHLIAQRRLKEVDYRKDDEIMADINELKNRKLGPKPKKRPETTADISSELAKRIAARAEEKRIREAMEEEVKKAIDVDNVDVVLDEPVDEVINDGGVSTFMKTDDTKSSSNIIYDMDDEIKKRAESNGIVDEKTENVDNPYKASCNPDGTVSEHQRNVFEDGLHDGTFVAMHICPMCGVGKKTIRGLEVKKKIGFFRFIQKRIGYMSICANCGHVDFYATDPDELLLYLRGKVKP
jgi:hypothetical protein